MVLSWLFLFTLLDANDKITVIYSLPSDKIKSAFKANHNPLIL
nr:MAG TPA: hypothetical protein [Caudoviricetes sp.]